MIEPFNTASQNSLPKNIKILGVCNVTTLDSSPVKIYNWFLRFKNYAFAPNERLLILDHDTDYYPSMCSVGNNMYNFFKIISALDISTNHIVIVTANYGLQKDITYLSDMYDVTPPRTIEFALWYTFPTIVDYTIPQIDKKYLYTCLNGVPRVHRKILLALLEKHNLIDQGLISWNNAILSNNTESIQSDSDVSVDHSDSTVDLAGIHFRTTQPFTRINEDLSNCRESKILQSHCNFNTVVNPIITGSPNDARSRWYVDFLHNSLVYLITETVGQSPYVYFSEKTWKAMASKMPFVLLGAQHSIKKLKDFGFKTFDSVWDESYDSSPSLYKRAVGIINVLAYLDQQDFNNIQKQILPIVEYNFQHMKTFEQSQINQLIDI